MNPTQINSGPTNLLNVVTLLNDYKTEKKPTNTKSATRCTRANETEESFRRTQVVVFQSHPSVSGQIRVPKRDWFEPPGEGSGGADVACERGTKWAEDWHRLREVEGDVEGNGWNGICWSVLSGLPDGLWRKLYAVCPCLGLSLSRDSVFTPAVAGMKPLCCSPRKKNAVTFRSLQN